MNHTTPVSAFPLQWPEHIPRTVRRETSRFQTTLPAALNNVQRSLRLFASDSDRPLENLVISSNVTLGAVAPEDPGVAVWFIWDQMQVCIPVDRYVRVEHNLQAIHHVAEARRTEMRHGTLALVRATFMGFKALPPPPGQRGWRGVLGLAPGNSITRANIETAYRSLAKTMHPDQGGSIKEMSELNEARDRAIKEIGG